MKKSFKYDKVSLFRDLPYRELAAGICATAVCCRSARVAATVTAKEIAASAVAGETGDEKNPDQPFAGVAATSVVVAAKEISATISAAVAAKARKKQDNPYPTATAGIAAGDIRCRVIATAVARC